MQEVDKQGKPHRLTCVWMAKQLAAGPTYPATHCVIAGTTSMRANSRMRVWNMCREATSQ